MDHVQTYFNEYLISSVNKRLEFGKKKYNHGVIIRDDTRNYGTPNNSWEEMLLEELLDGIIYSFATIIKINREISEKKGSFKKEISNSKDDNEEIVKCIKNTIEKKECGFYKHKKIEFMLHSVSDLINAIKNVLISRKVPV